MTATALAELTAEVDAAVRDGTPARRARMVEQFAAFFLAHAERLSFEQLNLFDNVMARLVSRADARSLIELSTALAGVNPAPEQTIRSLACHDNPAVAAPALASEVLSDAELTELARHCGQQHLLAITRRKRLNQALTEIVLRHSGKDALRAVVKNAGACFSPTGYTTILAAAERDDVVAEALGLRPDVPADTLQSLLAKTTDVVRARLLKGSPPAVRERVQAALAAVPAPAPRKTQAQDDLAAARAAVIALNKTGQLGDSSVNRFAIRREYPNVIAALALLSGAAVEIIAPLMDEEGGNGLIIACRGSRLNWQTTQTVLNNRRVPPLPKDHLEAAREMFDMLYVSAAQYTVRFEMPPAGADSNERPQQPQGVADEGETRKTSRVKFEHAHPVNLMGVDGTWRRSCVLLDVSQSGAKLEIEGSPDVLRAREFFLLLSSTGLAFRRCELVWVDGTQVGVKFTNADKKSRAKAATASS